MSDEAAEARFFVRLGGKGWMVYDRKLKGPAMIGTKLKLAANLTREQAEHVHRILIAGADPKSISF
ncbi:hypothetical protein [Bradyrhizobium iriomotense]|uniref:Uncharacterized protein n=1 Tax=Bradyrhizobium iriomotense TaxID=441950 RepID=A0ABQ6BAB7_9BRAD|nr:hypothetical protein [Bradyrhizobium iriomotense]GLR91317.1 hypothetical protein GCM10007857_80340 [Bradyrhizobium iriomotense]